MKCVQDRSDLQTWRVSDKDAERKVKTGLYEYASRKLWKLQGRRAV